jgi:hypothetical protein
MKKVLTAALICAVSAFAAWDKFPVIERGKGEAKLYWETGSQGSKVLDEPDGFYGIRYSPISNLEFAAYANNDYALGLRYQIISVLSAGVDVSFPLPGAYWAFTPNFQFSMPLTSSLTLGSNFEMTINTEGKYIGTESKYINGVETTEATETKKTNGIDAVAGVELDFAINEKNTIWISCDLEKGITKTESNGEDISRKGEDRGLGIYPQAGYLITLGNLDLGTYIKLGFGKDAGNGDIVTITGIDAAIKF